jgi:hypothetical protein
MKRTAKHLHPWILSIFPLLNLYTHNIDQIDPIRLVVPILVTLLTTALLWFILTTFFHQGQKAPLLTSFLLLVFFSYGYLLDAFHVHLFGTSLFHHYIAFPIWLLVLGLGTMAIVTKISSPSVWNTLGNALSAGLLLVIVGQVSAHYLQNRPPDPGLARENEPTQGTSEGALPDIYYIVLDGYGRSDILDSLYHFDNTSFLNSLQKQGFFIASKARSNYGQTLLSMSSTLNMDYVQNLVSVTEGYEDRAPLRSLVDNNQVFQRLDQLDYQIITTDMGRDSKYTDIHLSLGWFADEYTYEVVNLTPITAVLSLASSVDILDVTNFYERHRRQIQYIFDRVPDFSEWETPTFVYAHILAPHPPFVFTSDGESKNPHAYFSISDGDSYRKKFNQSCVDYRGDYIQQLQYINTKTLAMVNEILDRSGPNTVIILQGDHGPGSELHFESKTQTNIGERFSILNAYYVSDSMKHLLYDSITPVNTFRLLFDHCFQLSYSLLEDRSYYSTWSRPFDFQRILMNEDHVQP